MGIAGGLSAAFRMRSLQERHRKLRKRLNKPETGIQKIKNIKILLDKIDKHDLVSRRFGKRRCRVRADLQSWSRIVRQVRREKGLTQSELARRAGCRQSAISMFERGRRDALSDDRVEAVARVLGVALSPDGGRVARPERLTLKYCPEDDCPSNVPVVVGDRLVMLPRLVEAEESEKTRCGCCGELLESACPNVTCGAEIRGEGGFCRVCGSVLVTVVHPPGEPLRTWAERRRRRIREIRELTVVERRRETGRGAGRMDAGGES